MSESAIHGGCLCGTVTFEIDPPFQRMVHCHCSRCRKGTGTGHATNLFAAPGQIRWRSGEDAISRYELPSAKRFGKWFCARCGSPLPRVTRDGQALVIPAGSRRPTADGADRPHFLGVARALELRGRAADPRRISRITPASPARGPRRLGSLRSSSPCPVSGTAAELLQRSLRHSRNSGNLAATTPRAQGQPGPARPEQAYAAPSPPRTATAS